MTPPKIFQLGAVRSKGMPLCRTPLVSVVMPVFNGARYLAQAMESILTQSVEDLELLIVDDGSTDASRRIASAHPDRRVVVLGGAQNHGVARRLNDGFESARAPYVARMDADDVAAPRRLERQLRFLEAHPSVGICGSWSRSMGPDGRIRERFKMPGSHARICARAIFGPPLLHPTVMFNMRRFPDGPPRYSTDAPHAEDYDLWERLLPVVEMANVPEYLHFYRIHAQQVSVRFDEQQGRTGREVRARSLTKWGVPYDADELALHCAISTGRPLADRGQLQQARRWLEKLRRIAGWRGKSAVALRWECHLRELFL